MAAIDDTVEAPNPTPAAATDPLPQPTRPTPLPQTLHPARRDRTGPWLQFRVPHGFEFNRYDVSIPHLRPDLVGLRILHLSDLHLKRFWSPTYDQLVARINQSNPDLILITGDFVDSKTHGPAETPTAVRLVSALRARLGIYGILGNHDGDLAGAYLPRAGVRLLDNEHASPADGIQVIGTADVSREDIDWAALRSLPPKPPGGVRILLSHYPDTLRKLIGPDDLQPDLLLAGHTHGGQVCLPGGTPIIRHDSLPRRLCKGVHRVHNTWLSVTRGLGFTSLPIRIFCPAEVIELVLQREYVKT